MCLKGCIHSLFYGGCMCVCIYDSDGRFQCCCFFPCGSVYQFVVVYICLPSLLKNKLLSMLLLANLSDRCIRVTEREHEKRYGPISMPIHLFFTLLFLSTHTFIPQPAKCVHPSRADRNKNKICYSSLSKLTQSKWKRGRRRVREEGVG